VGRGGIRKLTDFELRRKDGTVLARWAEQRYFPPEGPIEDTVVLVVNGRVIGELDGWPTLPDRHGQFHESAQARRSAVPAAASTLLPASHSWI
jgi:hypothetical protein